MKSATRFALVITLGLAFLSPMSGSAGAECGDIYPAMALGPFPPDAQTTTPLFYASEDASNASFKVHWTGFSCGQHLPVSAEYSDVGGSATEGPDYSLPPGRTPDVCDVGCPSVEATINVGIVDDGEEQVTELFTVALSTPAGGSLDPPSTAPFVIVDTDGTSPRVAFDELAYSQSESYGTLAVAVWRAGSASGSIAVPYTVGPGPGNGATLNEDYVVTSPNPLVFAANDRVELITLSIVNDKLSEGDETVALGLQGAVSPSAKTVTIVDNEENQPPTSRLHHPREKWRYSKSDYRLREIHVFTLDQGGSGVVGAELALRRNLKNDKCAWWAGSRWKQGDCQSRVWHAMTYQEFADLFYYRMRKFTPSVRTRIVDYTAYSRAIDGAGNVEDTFNQKRNANTFEVKRGRR